MPDSSAEMPLLVSLTGASGSGKTTLAHKFLTTYPHLAVVYHFDSVGVPRVEEMIELNGSPQGWQEATTHSWMKCFTQLKVSTPAILFEGQSRISFLHRAAQRAGIVRHRIVLVDCDDRTRRDRLRSDRRQPELANDSMMSWARFLRAEAATSQCAILDTSGRTVEQALTTLRGLVRYELRHNASGCR